jgi:hypothetical protein
MMYYLVCREELCHPGQASLGQASCMYDCLRLSIFTGSRLGEYGQSNVRRADGSDAFDPVPNSVHVPPAFRGKPLAFISSDFKFFDNQRRIIPQLQALVDPAVMRKLRVRFRYDKGPDNFAFRTFNRNGHFLCAVEAALSLIRRATRLHRDFASDSEPLAMFLAVNRRHWTVRGRHVQQFMQKACILAHPDGRHHLRRYIHCLMAHCGRVTAAVAPPTLQQQQTTTTRITPIPPLPFCCSINIPPPTQQSILYMYFFMLPVVVVGSSSFLYFLPLRINSMLVVGDLLPTLLVFFVVWFRSWEARH